MKRKTLKLFAAAVLAVPMLYGSSFAGTCGGTPCVDSADIINGQIVGADIANSAVSGPKLAPGSVGTGKIVDNAVTGVKVLDGSLTGADIQDGSIGVEDLGFALGDVTGVSAGTGLTGGGASGDVSLGVDFGGNGAAGTAARSDHNHNALYQKRYGKTAVVAVSNGQYTSPVQAMNNVASWCGTPSATNPCVVKIMPGIYNQGTTSLNMQPYVDIEGSGENVTVIKGAVVSPDVAPNGLVNGASNAELRFLTVQNTTNASGLGLAIVNKEGASPALTNLTVISTGTALVSDVAAIASVTGGAPRLTNINAIVTGGNNTTGVYCGPGSATRLNNVYVQATGAPSNNIGVYNENANTTISNSAFVVSGGSWDDGILSELAGTVHVNNSAISGSVKSTDGSTVYVGASRITGSVSGSVKCAGVYDSNYEFILDCPLGSN
jgi:hypothetical protein